MPPNKALTSPPPIAPAYDTFPCPRCGGAAKRTAINQAATASGFLMGGIVLGLPVYYLRRSFASYRCVNCGKLPFRELPPELRKQIWTARITSVVVWFFAIIIACIIIAAISR
jgi:predicted RNA-binding Zn-ribbon protein involved in translation (DUF1610 family)